MQSYCAGFSAPCPKREEELKLRAVEKQVQWRVCIFLDSEHQSLSALSSRNALSRGDSAIVEPAQVEDVQTLPLLSSLAERHAKKLVASPLPLSLSCTPSPWLTGGQLCQPLSLYLFFFLRAIAKLNLPHKLIGQQLQSKGDGLKEKMTERNGKRENEGKVSE